MTDDPEIIETPAAAVQTRVVPENIEPTVEPFDELVSLGLMSEHVQGRLYLDVEDAQALGEELLSAVDKVREES